MLALAVGLELRDAGFVTSHLPAADAVAKIVTTVAR